MMGMNVERVIATAFFIGGALAGAAGMVVGLYLNTGRYLMGFDIGLKAFTAAVLGGIGNIPGAVLGGYPIGFLAAFSDQYISSTWTRAVVFAILILVLVFRPWGFLGHPPRSATDAGSLAGTAPATSAVYRPWGSALRALLLFPFVDLAWQLATLNAVTDAAVFVVLALGLNIVVGYAGLLDLGYAAFFAIGAYTMGIFTWPPHGLELNFWWACCGQRPGVLPCLASSWARRRCACVVIIWPSLPSPSARLCRLPFAICGTSISASATGPWWKILI